MLESVPPRMQDALCDDKWSRSLACHEPQAPVTVALDGADDDQVGLAALVAVHCEGRGGARGMRSIAGEVTVV